jgi:predicted Zn-dependent protease
MLAGQFAYGREHEREADAIGVALMRRAGYDAAEASRVWENLRLELRERPDGGYVNPLFATHPAADERMSALAELAKASPGGVTNEAAWLEHVKPYLRDWLAEEVKRGQHEESLALLTRLSQRSPESALYLWARGEVFRLRAAQGDLDLAMADYLNAIAVGGEPPETHRGVGLIHRARRNASAARASLQRYLEGAPQAPDAGLIKSYLEELPT